MLPNNKPRYVFINEASLADIDNIGQRLKSIRFYSKAQRNQCEYLTTTMETKKILKKIFSSRGMRFIGSQRPQYLLAHFPNY